MQALLKLCIFNFSWALLCKTSIFYWNVFWKFSIGLIGCILEAPSFLSKIYMGEHFSLYLCVKTLCSSHLPTVFLLIKKCSCTVFVEEYWVQGKEWVSQRTFNVINRHLTWILVVIQSSEWRICIRQKDDRDLILPTKHIRYFCGLKHWHNVVSTKAAVKNSKYFSWYVLR